LACLTTPRPQLTVVHSRSTFAVAGAKTRRFGVRSGSSGWMKRSELPLVLRRFSVFLPDGGADELLEEIGAPAVRGEIDYR